MLVLPLLLLGPVTNATEERSVKSTITNVTVFLSGAQIERTATVDLPKGTTRLVFKELSEEADPASIQVSGTGGFTILSVKPRIDHGKAPTGTAEVKDLEAGIQAIERTIQDEQSRIGVLQNEEQRLLKNEAFDGGDQGLSMERIKAINDYFRERITAVREGIIALQRRIAERTEEAQHLHLQLGQLQGKKPKAYGEVLVEVASDRAVHSTFTVRYVVRSAGWSPQYDIRVHSVSAPLALTYKANVYQHTGEDWADVKLELASGDPRVNGVMPEMAIWRLSAGAPPPGAVQRTPLAYDAAVREVRGIVRDASTGEPLPFVTVMLTTAEGGTLNGAQSNMDGYYAVAVPPGARQIGFTYVGYGPQRMDISGNTLNVSLQQDHVQLSAVEVVGNKQPLRENSSAMTITREEIMKTPQRSIAGIRIGGGRHSDDHLYVDGALVGGTPAAYGDVTNAGPEVSVRRATTHFTFAITLPYSIPSDGQGHMVAVKEHDVASVYRYYCTPKLDPNAYLFAKATGWDKLDLLSGPANLYFEGTFIGESFLDAEQVLDTLDISLGRDRAVVVKREKRVEMDQKAFTGSKRTETIGWTIDVRNMKGLPIDLVLTDQVPVSVVSEIEVETTEHDGAAFDTAKGFLTWRDHIPSNGTAHHTFTYAVKAPKQMPLILE